MDDCLTLLSRFSHPGKLVSYFGLNPRVRQSGLGPAHYGRISKVGRSHARAMLVEAAWSAAKAAQDFDRLRIDVVGATINAPLHQMPVEPAAIRPGPWIGNFTARAPALSSAAPLNSMPQVSATKQKVAVPLPSPKDKQTAKTSHMGPAPGTQKFRASPKQAEAVSPAAAGMKSVTLTQLKGPTGPNIAVRSRTPTTQQAVGTKPWTPNSSRTTKSRRER